jgi:AraC family transcriptional regulator
VDTLGSHKRYCKTIARDIGSLRPGSLDRAGFEDINQILHRGHAIQHAQRRVPMLRPESVCHLQIDGITIERRAQATALVGAREMELNHVVMQLTSPATLEIGSASGKHLRRFVPGDIHVIPQGSKVSLYATGASHAIVMSFENQVLERSGEEKDRVGYGPSLVLHLGIRDLQLQCLLSAVEEELRSGCHTGSEYLHQLGGTLTSYLVRRYSTAAETVPPVSEGLPPNRLRAVLDHIHTHLEESLTVVDLASMVSMSPQHFANLFRRSTGLAPHRYVLGRRIERAAHLLSTTNLSLAEITLESGFASQSHFTDVFRKALGTTPRRYRGQFVDAPPHANGSLPEMKGRVAIGMVPSGTILKKPPGTLSGSGAAPEQLSIYFDDFGLKCG